MKKINITILSILALWQFGCKCEKQLTCQDGNPATRLCHKGIEQYYQSIVNERDNKFKGAIDILDKINIMDIDFQTKKKVIALRETLDQQRTGSQDIIKGVIFAYNSTPCDAEVRKRYFDVMDKLAADNAAAIQIKNDLEPVLNSPEELKNNFNKTYKNYNKTKVEASQKAIQMMQTEEPTNGLILQAFWAFEFDENKETSLEEAKKMLQFLGAVEIQKNIGCADCCVGRLLSGYYVIIWQSTYGKKDTYGIRYGKRVNGGFPFIGNNYTYVEIEK